METAKTAIAITTPAAEVYSKNYSQSFNAPSSIEEFLADGWQARINSRIRRFVLYDVCNDVEDLCQDIICSLISTDYISRYNGSSPFESYIYVFVDNYLRRKYAKENTRFGKKIVTRASLEISTPVDDGEYEPGVVYLETLLDSAETLNGVDFQLALAELKKRLDLRFKATSCVEYNGHIIERKPSTVLTLLSCDVSVAEIAEILDTSKQFIYSLIKKIRLVAPDYFEYIPKK